MRTTVDLPDDLHRRLVAIVHDRRETLSQTTTAIIRRALDPGVAAPVRRDPRTGLLVASLGRVVTGEDVRPLEDEA
jgi:predicted transcriptional regulator